MARYQYPTSGGVCSRSITFDLTDGKVSDISFMGGCAGNTKGVAKLAEGRDAKEVIELLKGTPCGYRPTSCPDQLARALEAALSKQQA